MAIQENKQQQLCDTLVAWLRNHMQQANTQKLEIDISGGIDSAVCAELCVRAAGVENVIAVFSGCHSNPVSLYRARAVAHHASISMLEYDLSTAFDLVVDQCKHGFARLGVPFPDEAEQRIVFGSLRSTLRAPVGRFTNRAFGGGLRVGTGNRDEDELVRFYQKGGDGEVDNNPIAGLFKSEVWQLAEWLGVPDEVIKATPTPDLWGHDVEHTDEGELHALTGVRLTYTRPDQEMGSIEWSSRQNQEHGVITGEHSQTPLEELKVLFSYTDEQTLIIKAMRHMESITRHKSEMPPMLPREVLQQAKLVD
ncbi:MAG: NAD(+) synthase [Mariprofundales bacterium]